MTEPMTPDDAVMTSSPALDVQRDLVSKVENILGTLRHVPVPADLQTSATLRKATAAAFSLLEETRKLLQQLIDADPETRAMPADLSEDAPQLIRRAEEDLARIRHRQ